MSHATSDEPASGETQREGVLLTLLEGDLALLNFRLGDVLLELKSSITRILHIGMWKGVRDVTQANVWSILLGWRVDFNFGFSTFEPNVAGVRNLINFAVESKLSTPPCFIFVSTVAVVACESDTASAQCLTTF